MRFINLQKIISGHNGGYLETRCVTINADHISYIEQHEDYSNILLIGNTLIQVKDTKQMILAKIGLFGDEI